MNRWICDETSTIPGKRRTEVVGGLFTENFFQLCMLKLFHDTMGGKREEVLAKASLI